MKWVITFFLLSFPSLTFGSDFVQCSGPDCDLCDLVIMINAIIVWVTTISVTIATILFAYAGFRLTSSGGDTSAVKSAKDMMVNVVIGVIIIFAAVTIVDTVMKLLTDDDRFGFWREPDPQSCGTMFKSGEPVALDIKTDVDETDTLIEGYEIVRTGNTVKIISPGTGDPSLNNGSTNETVFEGVIGEGNQGIVDYAKRMEAKGCLYNQSRRNGCNGNPGYTDCSDLVNLAYRVAGCQSPGTFTGNQITNARTFGSRSELRAGDAPIYRSGGKGHVVICMNDGCSQVIHAKGRNHGIVIGNGSPYTSGNYTKAIRASDFCS